MATARNTIGTIFETISAATAIRSKERRSAGEDCD